MRIIGGSARGRTLFAPPGLGTRPTQDAVRESLFNILRREVPESAVLDLFAGTGSLALESLSRGACRAVLVDRAPQAMQAIRRNVEHAGFVEQCECLGCDWQAAIARLRGGERFDLVFLDPPYGQVTLEAVFAALASSALLAEDALLVAEHRTGEQPDIRPPFTVEDARRYGDTTVTMVRYRAHDSCPEQDSCTDLRQDLRTEEIVHADSGISGQL